MNAISQKKFLWLFWLGLLIIAGLASWYLAACMAFAPWGFSDTATYFSSARNLARGLGLGTYSADGTFLPLEIFAPFYSIVLSPFAGLDLIAVSRVLDVVFFALLILSSGWLFYRVSDSWLLALCFSVLIAMTPALARDYTSMMSEPLAIALGLPGFLLLLLALKRDSFWLLFFAGLLAALASLTRYALVAIPVAGTLSVLLMARLPWRKRLKNGAIYAAVSFLPIVAWLARQWLMNGSVGSRHYSLNIDFKAKIVDFFTHVVKVTKYWFPYRTGMIPGVTADFFTPVLAALFVIVVAGGLILSLTLHRIDDRQFCTGLLIFGFILLIAAYLGFLFLTYTVSSETISLDERMLSPLPVMVYALLLAASLSLALKLHPHFSWPVIGLLLTLCFAVFNYIPLRTYLINVSTYPDGYASPDWKDKPIFAAAQKLSAQNPLLSNAPDILLFYNNQSVYYLSRAKRSGQTIVTLADTANLKKLMSEDCGAIVLFDPSKADAYEHRPQPLSEQDVKELQTLYISFYAGKDGEILLDPQCMK